MKLTEYSHLKDGLKVQAIIQYKPRTRVQISGELAHYNSGFFILNNDVKTLNTTFEDDMRGYKFAWYIAGTQVGKLTDSDLLNLESYEPIADTPKVLRYRIRTRLLDIKEGTVFHREGEGKWSFENGMLCAEWLAATLEAQHGSSAYFDSLVDDSAWWDIYGTWGLDFSSAPNHIAKILEAHAKVRAYAQWANNFNSTDGDRWTLHYIPGKPDLLVVIAPKNQPVLMPTFISAEKAELASVNSEIIKAYKTIYEIES
jgi:hypothetical protein